MPRLKDRIAVITGSGAGMGEGIARLFAAEGASVVISDLDKHNGDAVAASIAAQGGKAVFQHADVRIEEECRALVDRAVKVFGRIDVLVNNAGISPRGNVETTKLKTWDNVFAVNVRGPFICMQQAVTYMKNELSGSIINIGSVNAYIGEPKLTAYAASKGALMTLTKNSAQYLNRYRIRVNQLNVGWTLTPNENVVKLQEGKGENWIEEAVKTRPFGRLLLPHDIALAALYFASDESAAITGSVLDLEQYPVGSLPNW